MRRRDQGMVPHAEMTTLTNVAMSGDQFIYIAMALPAGATIRVDGGPAAEVAIVKEPVFVHSMGHTAALVQPLERSHYLGSVVAVLAHKGECAHLAAVPVESTDGETVAWLCPPPCDTQLPEDWRTQM